MLDRLLPWLRRPAVEVDPDSAALARLFRTWKRKHPHAPQAQFWTAVGTGQIKIPPHESHDS